LHENIQALKIKLTDQQIKYLESVKPFDLGFPQSIIGADPHETGKSGYILAATAQISWVRNPKPIGPPEEKATN